MHEFGAHLRALRLERGMTQAFLATKAGIGKGYLSDIEAGKVPPPAEEAVRSLAKTLGADVTDLLVLAYMEKVPVEVRKVLEGSVRQAV